MSIQIAKKIYFDSCYEELTILKPGNHSIYSKIMGMSLAKFIQAARISSEIITNKKLNIGESIFYSSKRCFDQLGSNYNLGIIILCTPIIKVFLDGFENFRNDLKKKINGISNYEGKLILDAISYVKPAGINNFSGPGDVKNINLNLSFAETMLIGSEWDRVSKCYIENYSEIFDFGLPAFQKLKHQTSRIFAKEFTYLNYLSSDTDSHLQRKFGKETALKVKKKCFFLKKRINHKKLNYQKILLDFDKYLKNLHYNPGTCADLTVTTLLIDKITDIVSNPITNM